MEGDAKSVQNIVEIKKEDIVAQKLEEIKLEVDENVETSPKVTDQMKRGSLSKLFRFKKSSSVENVYSETDPKVSKSNTLTRMFNKKTKVESKQNSSDETSRLSFFKQFPWIGRQTSQMNIHKPMTPLEHADDDSVHQEIATSSQIF
jgi:hypothetical protein